MAKIVIDCGEGVTVEDLMEQIEKRGCDLTYFHDAQKRIESGDAKSQREASRQIAEETGEAPEAVRTKVRRGAEQVGQVDPEVKGLSSSPRVKRWARRQEQKKKCQYYDMGPRTSEVKDELPAEYQELKRVADAIGLKLPVVGRGSEYEMLPGTERMTRQFMRFAYARGDIPKEIKEWFEQNRRERSERGYCWICTRFKARTKKIGLCHNCRDVIKGDRRKLELQAREVCQKTKLQWEKINLQLSSILQQIEEMPADDPPPRIEIADAKIIFEVARELYWLVQGTLNELAYADCYT